VDGLAVAVADKSVPDEETGDPQMKALIPIAPPTKPMPLSRLHVVVAACVLAALGLVASLPTACAQQSNERTFATPGEAVLALYSAVKDNDQAALAAIFGTNSGDVLHSGDEVEDKKAGQDFLQRYEQMHRVVIEPDGTGTLYIGG
jgi:hypothetical protein